MNCPKCYEALTIGSTFCECGWRDKSAPIRNNLGPSKCVFTTEGRQCRMVGTIGAGGGQWFCSWHDHVLNSRDKAQDKKRFMEWLKKWEGRHSNWTEQLPEITWRNVMAFDGPMPKESWIDPEAKAEREAIQRESA